MKKKSVIKSNTTAKKIVKMKSENSNNLSNPYQTYSINGVNGEEKNYEKKDSYKSISIKNKTEDVDKLKVLVVDDENFVRMYLGIVLENVSREIIYAETGVEAIKQFEANKDIDLILMDINMPEMDGLEATRRIKALNNDVCIIVQSAFLENQMKEKIMSSGANDYLSKPINKKKLLEIIETFFIKK
jgi:CheY-like chemotaxis protein